MVVKVALVALRCDVVVVQQAEQRVEGVQGVDGRDDRSVVCCS